MDSQIPPAPDLDQLAIIQKKLLLDNKIRSGVGWFYWIAGFSLINTIVYLLGFNLTFMIGLGATQIVDGLMTVLANRLGEGWSIVRLTGLVIDICIAGVFILFGFFGRKRIRWPIILGIILYAIDGVIILLLKDYFGAAFHGLALFGIWSGLKSIKELEILEKSWISASIEQIRQQLALSQKPIVTPKQRRFRWILVGLIFIIIVSCVILLLVQQ
jgi:hypothetical protein